MSTFCFRSVADVRGLPDSSVSLPSLVLWLTGDDFESQIKDRTALGEILSGYFPPPDGEEAGWIAPGMNLLASLIRDGRLYGDLLDGSAASSNNLIGTSDLPMYGKAELGLAWDCLRVITQGSPRHLWGGQTGRQGQLHAVADLRWSPDADGEIHCPQSAEVLRRSEEANNLAGYAIEIIGELARQLLVSPQRHRLRQMEGAEYLVHLIEPKQSYPYDLIVYHITQYRRAKQAKEQPLLQGKPLISDLVQLIEDLSNSIDLSADQLGQAYWTLDQLGERLRISSKTIHRWRRRGLVSYRAKTRDGRRRPIFTDRAVRRFVSKNPKLVKRATTFTKLSDEDRETIVAEARELIENGARRISEVADRVSAKVGRSPETVRYVLRRHDRENPNAKLFDRTLKLGSKEHLRIYRCYQAGDAVEAIAARFGRRPAAVYRIVTEIRARKLLARVPDFIDSEEFHEPDADQEILGLDGAPGSSEASPKRKRPSGDLPAYLKELYEMPLLDRDQEHDLFRRYNYLKCKAKTLADTLEAETATTEELNELEVLLNRSDVMRNRIINANLRLVVSIAKKHARRGEDLFHVISDGNISLMKAVEKFDYTRGNKFSTYATWAIMKNYARSIPDERYQLTRYQTGHDEQLQVQADPHDHVASADRRMEGVRRALDEVLAELPARERMILIRHYGLVGDGTAQTLEEIGKDFDISKERARQLEKRALKKLRESVNPSLLDAVLS